MGIFEEQVRAFAPGEKDVEARRWIYVPYDRLTDAAGPLAEQAAEETGIVMMEALAKARRRPYHKKKLALIVAGQRHFALEQGRRGVKVIYEFTPGIFADGLAQAVERYGLRELEMMEPAERELRLDVAEAQRRGVPVKVVRDTTWCSTEEDFDGVFQPGTRQFVMDRFYRRMRQKTGILMGRDGEPLGGKYSHDAENRKPYRGEPRVPQRPRFALDEITGEALEMVEREFPGHFGALEGFDLAVTQADAEALWGFVRKELLPHFGPFEDAMVEAEPEMFHSKLSAVINVGRLLPGRLVAEVGKAADAGEIPVASAEGFIRQILGWREFMRHLHRRTDGYRKLPGGRSAGEADAYAGAEISALDGGLPLPAAYWGKKSGLHCVDVVVEQVWREGWSHHITRLMVLSNLATLCGVSPRELTDWFWIAFVDAYDWVVEPNVLGMGTWADGGVTATKPYVSGAAYIHRMSDYCGRCGFDPKKATGEDACPFTALYWTFLERNADKLTTNPRMSLPLASLRKKPAGEMGQLRERAAQAVDALWGAAEVVTKER